MSMLKLQAFQRHFDGMRTKDNERNHVVVHISLLPHLPLNVTSDLRFSKRELSLVPRFISLHSPSSSCLYEYLNDAIYSILHSRHILHFLIAKWSGNSYQHTFPSSQQSQNSVRMVTVPLSGIGPGAAGRT
jgi:hypothetical protein